jgi:hypothetical protein
VRASVPPRGLDLGVHRLFRLGNRSLEVAPHTRDGRVLHLLERGDLGGVLGEAELMSLERVGLVADQLLESHLQLLLGALKVGRPRRESLLEPLLAARD